MGRNYQVRNNGVFTIGSYIKILSPLSIINSLGNEIPILKSRNLAGTMEPTTMVHSVCANFGLVQNNRRGFFSTMHILPSTLL